MEVQPVVRAGAGLAKLELVALVGAGGAEGVEPSGVPAHDHGLGAVELPDAHRVVGHSARAEGHGRRSVIAAARGHRRRDTGRADHAQEGPPLDRLLLIAHQVFSSSAPSQRCYAAVAGTVTSSTARSALEYPPPVEPVRISLRLDAALVFDRVRSRGETFRPREEREPTMRNSKMGLGLMVLLTSCGTLGGGVGGMMGATCRGDLGGTAGAQKVEAFIAASSAFAGASVELQAGLLNACRQIGHELAIPDSELGAGDSPRPSARPAPGCPPSSAPTSPTSARRQESGSRW